MRLIHTTTLDFEEFFGDHIPPYAILSHTWEKEEVTLQEWANRSAISGKAGYKKIVDTCRKANKQGYNYVWVDTNCIDKTSSAELSEAINSMFDWYRWARVCYVYLADVVSSGLGLETVSAYELLRSSRWFSRGWTLQELLAPPSVEFYSKDWSFLGTKASLCSDIADITGIGEVYLWHKHAGALYTDGTEQYVLQSIEYSVPVSQASVAERLCWLSNRRTTRSEDMAYCMLGIFGLSMPLLYGEGSKAFTRLQEEIMKVSDDQSLFCWKTTQLYDRGSFLSTYPSGFSEFGSVVPRRSGRPSPYTMTNAGLSIAIPILRCWSPSRFIGVLQATSGVGGPLLGLPMSGSMDTGRMCRGSYPPTPIFLAKGVRVGADTSVFVTGNDGPQYTLASVRRPSYSKPVARSRLWGWNNQVILTFEPQSETIGINTYPPDRFITSESCLTLNPISYDTDLLLAEKRGVPFSPLRADNTEAVFVHIMIVSRAVASFVICGTGHWREGSLRRLHCWRLSPDTIARLRNRQAEDLDTWLDPEAMYNDAEVRRAIADPDYARSVDFKDDSLGFSIAITDAALVTGMAPICHAHLSWNPQDEGSSTASDSLYETLRD